jgi:hypothetical protein
MMDGGGGGIGKEERRHGATYVTVGTRRAHITTPILFPGLQPLTRHTKHHCLCLNCGRCAWICTLSFLRSSTLSWLVVPVQTLCQNTMPVPLSYLW